MLNRLESVTKFHSKQTNALERVLDLKEYFDKQQKKEEKGQKVTQIEEVKTGRVQISVAHIDCLIALLFSLTLHLDSDWGMYG